VWSGVSTCSIKQFTRLKLLRLDLLCQNFTSIADAPSTLHEVDMRNIIWPSPTIYANIASIFHHVRILRLRQPRPWCGLCNLCEFPNFCEDATETIKYEGGLGLPVSLINRYLPMSFAYSPAAVALCSRLGTSIVPPYRPSHRQQQGPRRISNESSAE
jgi:hypothetical protein